MKKISWILLLSFLLLFVFFSFTYSQSMKPLKIAREDAVSRVLSQTEMVLYEDFELYHGLETVSIVKGRNAKGEKIIVWIPENEKDEWIIKKEKDGITKNQAKDKALRYANSDDIIDIRLGMENGIPFWEIYYQTGNNLINYYYVDFESGEWLKKIENL